MTTALPPPPVPADADLTDFKFMPLEVGRLRRSKAWLICKRRPELAFYMLNLWTAAWHERPAGSLEDDDDVLADAAMCSPEKWPKVRADVLRGWWKAADGRLYHPVVAEKVMDSWHGKAVARWTKECDRVRKENHKRKENQLPALEFPPKPDRKVTAVPPESGGIPPEKPLKGRDREREGKGEGSKKESPPPAAASVVSDDGGDGAKPQAAADGPGAAMASRKLVDEAFKRWSLLAYDLKIPDVGYLNRDRRAALTERLAEIGGLDGWDVFLAKVRGARFLMGPDDKPKFWVGLGKLLEPETFSKVLEDRYERDERSSSGDERSTSAAIAGLREEFSG